MTKAEEAFVDQYTRRLMVDLCHNQMTSGSPFRFEGEERKPEYEPYIAHAISKKWLSADGKRVLSQGWMTAMRFLKR